MKFAARFWNVRERLLRKTVLRPRLRLKPKAIRDLLWYPYEIRNQRKLDILMSASAQKGFPFETPIFHANGVGIGYHYSPVNHRLWDYLKDLSARFHPERQSAEGLAVVSCTNHPDKGILEECLERACFPKDRVHILGREVRSWQFVEKLRLLSEFVKFSTEPYILYCDSHDVLIHDLGAAFRNFRHSGAKMVMAADKRICFPGDYNRKYEEGIAAAGGYGPDAFIFLNSGVWFAEMGFARELFSDFDRRGPVERHPTDDQAVYKRWLRERHPNIKLDYARKIVQDLQFVEIDDLRLKDGESIR